jgi:hypothetical protein
MGLNTLSFVFLIPMAAARKKTICLVEMPSNPKTKEKPKNKPDHD